MDKLIQLSKEHAKTSAITALIDGNVRTPSLVRGEIYIMRQASPAGANSQPYSFVRFVGAGRGDETNPQLVEKNFRLKDMVEGDCYFLEAYDPARDQVYRFGAYQYEMYLAVGSSADRATFYSIKGHEAAQPAPTAPAQAPKPRAVRSSRHEDDGEPVGVEVGADYMLGRFTSR